MKSIGVALVVACCLACVGTAAAAPHQRRPAVTWLEAAPQSIPAAGGSVLVRAYVQNAVHCELWSRRGTSAALKRMKTVGCASGRASIRVQVAANPSTRLVGIYFELRARNAGAIVTKKLEVTQEARTPRTPKPKPAPPAPAPLEIVDTSLPSGLAGTPYSSSLLAIGGTTPYTWSVTAGTLPTGLTLSGEVLSGTPTVVGPSNFTLQVTDAKGMTATQAFTLPVNAALPAAAPGISDSSRNWSGYVLSGETYNSVAGSFNVPAIGPTPTDTTTAEWVGVDGSASGDHDLLQAGVTEEYSAATTQTQIFAWFEELPAPPTPLPMPVSVGDHITVDISMVTPGTWEVYLKDDTTGDVSSVTTPYSGTGQTAEWIVEAPFDTVTNSIVTIGYFTPVTFTQLGANAVSGALENITLVQNDVATATPSAMSATGFTVGYGSTAPGAP